jgi:hypothetical protein
MTRKSALVVFLALAAMLAATPAAQTAPPKFVRRVDNPWFPLKPGTQYVYVGEKDGESGRDVFTVTSRTKRISGVLCTEIDDRLYTKGHLSERTKDWYAQDVSGNVWYFGEDTAELNASGRVTSREGSWQDGVHGAHAGIFMPAKPKIGQTFRQEYYKGHAEDHFTVLDLAASVSVPYGSSKHALLTKEFTPLEPGVLDHKLYVRGIGEVKEETVKGGSERWELKDLSRR